MFVTSGMVSTYTQRLTELLFCEPPMNSFTCRWGELSVFCSFINFIFNYVVRYIRFVITVSVSSYCYCVIWYPLRTTLSLLYTAGVVIGHKNCTFENIWYYSQFIWQFALADIFSFKFVLLELFVDLDWNCIHYSLLWVTHLYFIHEKTMFIQVAAKCVESNYDVSIILFIHRIHNSLNLILHGIIICCITQFCHFHRFSWFMTTRTFNFRPNDLILLYNK